MLKQAPENRRIVYKIALAESQPFPDHEFDIITVGSGVHWFDIDKFLTEAKRLLKNKGWLILYENHFLSEMEGVKEFSDWFPRVYLKEFPSPPRNNNYYWTNENLAARNFTLINEETFKNSVELSKAELILYFTTQSNITAKVENSLSTYRDIENWLDKELTPFFTFKKRKLIYGNWIKYIEKNR